MFSRYHLLWYRSIFFFSLFKERLSCTPYWFLCLILALMHWNKCSTKCVGVLSECLNKQSMNFSPALIFFFSLSLCLHHNAFDMSGRVNEQRRSEKRERERKMYSAIEKAIFWCIHTSYIISSSTCLELKTFRIKNFVEKYVCVLFAEI